jgi:hypothetical protein
MGWQWFKRKLDDLSTHVIGGLILIGILFIATYWAIVLSWAGPSIILLAMGLLAIGLFMVNQVDIIKTRRSKGFAHMKNEKIESILRKWLDKRGLKISSDPQPNMLFQFKAEDMLGRAITVARPRNLDNFIIIGGSWIIFSQDQSLFDNMPDNIRSEMLENLQIELLRFKVNYDGLSHPLRKVGVEVFLPCDETCTESLFIQQFDTARFAYITMTTIMTRALRQANISRDNIPTQQ